MVFDKNKKWYRDGLNGSFIYNLFKEEYNILHYDQSSYNNLLKKKKFGLSYVGMNTYLIVNEKQWALTKIRYGI